MVEFYFKIFVELRVNSQVNPALALLSRQTIELQNERKLLPLHELVVRLGSRPKQRRHHDVVLLNLVLIR